MTTNARRNSWYCRSPANSRPRSVSGPMNSSANRYIIGLSVASDPRQISPNTPVETESSSSTSFGFRLTSPRIAPTTMPARTSTPTASTRRCLTMPMITPTAGSTPLSTSAGTAATPFDWSRW